jgi:putative SOS response-associated peptidase YedK
VFYLARSFSNVREVLRNAGFAVMADHCRLMPPELQTGRHGLLAIFNGRVLMPGLWGYLPTWIKDQSHFQLTARVETVFDKPMFRGPVRNSRCVVPVDGYIVPSPQALTLGTQHVHRPALAPFFIGGLYTENLDGNPTVALLTRPASGAMQDLSDRMPVAFENAATSMRWLTHSDPNQCLEWLEHHALGGGAATEC